MTRRQLALSFVTATALIVMVAAGATRTTAQTRTLAAPPPNFLVAFTGDQSLSSNARAVLELIRNEGASMTLVSGDLAYNENDAASPQKWDAMVSEILGDSYPLFVSQGNHDEKHWSGYRDVISARLARLSGDECTGDIGRESVCRFNGLTFTSTYRRANADFIRNALGNTNSLWTICSWHHNQQAMQVGGKGDEVGWGPYEACRQAGAIIATAHEHSYQRTKTLFNTETQAIDPQWPDSSRLRVAEGATFVFVSGAGGNSIRDQERCLPSTPPYGCKGEWANIYTSTQNAKFGALFIRFNVNGNPRLARGYFKTVDGQVIDEFTITNERPGTVAGEQPPANNPPVLSLEPNQTKYTVKVGETLTFAATATDRDGNTLSLDIPSLAQNFPGATFAALGQPQPSAAPSPRLSPSPAPSPAPSPSPITSPQPEVPSPTPTSAPPSPTPPGSLSSPYGVYPNCIAPAVGFENHSWWHQEGEQQPRHVHLAACLPNARANDGGGVTVSGVLPAVVRVMSFNNPGFINIARYAWQGNVIDVHSFNPRLQCQQRPDELKECTWYVPMNIDTNQMNVSGMDELRLTPNVQHDDLNTRQFGTNNFQIHRGGSGNYRSSPAFIARSWYTGLDYANVQWDNYVDLFRSPTETMPTVSGTITLQVRHDKCSGNSSVSHGFVDPNFHAVQRGEKPAPQPFYEQSGCFRGTVQLDTTKLANGQHGIYLQTQESDSRGQNSGAGLWFINVQN